MKSVNINATYRISAQRIRVRQSAYPRSVTMCTLVWLAFLPITRAVSTTGRRVPQLQYG